MIGEVRHYINSEAQSNDDATWRQELPNRGALHSILLKAKATNGATSGRAKTMHDVVDEVKVIGNGSEVLFALYPEELEKIHEAFQGQPLPMIEDQQASAVQEFVLPIMFGKHLLDTNYFLRLSKFQDIELQVSYSPSIAADSGFATGTVTFDVLLVITPEDAMLSYEGTLVTRRIRSYTTAASGIEELELPGESIIRWIGNYVYEAGVADGTNVTAIELEDKSTGKAIFTADWLEALDLNRLLFGADIRHQATLLLANDETWASRIGEVEGLNVEIEESADASNDEYDGAFVDGIAGDTLTFDAYNLKVTAGSETITAQSSDVTLRVQVWGKSPSYFAVIPFMYEDNRNGWLDTSQYGKLVVKQTNGNAGATAYLSIQEVRRY